MDDDELPNGGKHKKGLKASDDDEKENNEASRVVVDYVVLGDGQFTVQVVDKKIETICVNSGSKKNFQI